MSPFKKFVFGVLIPGTEIPKLELDVIIGRSKEELEKNEDVYYQNDAMNDGFIDLIVMFKEFEGQVMMQLVGDKFKIDEVMYNAS